MREVTLELDSFECPSGNQLRSMNHAVYKRRMEYLKKEILEKIGEGPWPKITFHKEYSAAVRRQVTHELKTAWEAKKTVIADVTIRRPHPIDPSNSHAGTRILWDALTRMGWLVDDHRKWLTVVYRDQVVGDYKVVVTLKPKD